jgi:hypothetical protein
MMKRDDYIKKLKAQFDLWNVEAAKWEAKTKMVQAEMKVEYEKQFETFQRQRDEALKKCSSSRASAAMRGWNSRLALMMLGQRCGKRSKRHASISTRATNSRRSNSPLLVPSPISDQRTQAFSHSL